MALVRALRGWPNGPRALGSGVAGLVLLVTGVSVWLLQDPPPGALVTSSPAHHNADTARRSLAVTSSQANHTTDTDEYSFTVVTAMLDIGRGNWTKQSRPYDQYLQYMQPLLKRHVNLVAFVDKAARPYVQRQRQGLEAHTKLIEVRLHDLPYYQHRQRVAHIMASEAHRQDNELWRQGLCEAHQPLYDIVQWSKLTFLGWAMDWDPFNSTLFMWLDGGYGHGHPEAYAPGTLWRPSSVLLRHLDQVTFIEREPVEKYRQYIDRLHKMSINILAGSYFAGGQRALRRLHELQRELIADWLEKGIVDDDQTTYLLMYFKEPQLFNLVRGDWYDVFRLFHDPGPTH